MADKIHKNASLSCIVPIARAVPPLESFGPRVHTTSMEASLVTQLSTYYSDSDEPWAEHDVIYEESDVLAFLPAPPDDFNPHDPKPLDVFTFPENLYIDSFLFSNFKLTQKKRTEIGQIAVDLNRLKAEKATVVEKVSILLLYRCAFLGIPLILHSRNKNIFLHCGHLTITSKTKRPTVKKLRPSCKPSSPTSKRL